MSCLDRRLVCNTALRTAVLQNAVLQNAGVSSLTLHQNFLLNSASTMAMAAVLGPTLTFTRASDAGSHTSDGPWVLVGGNNLPRFVHNPANGNAQRGLMQEREARTQLGKQTSNLSGDQWTAINSDVPTENNTDIFGGTSADELAATSTADQQVARYQSYTGLTANVNTAVAAHVKTGINASFVQVAWDSDGSGGDGCFCNFQLTGSGTKGTVTAMTAGTATRADIVLTTEGFYRCIVVGKIASGTVGRYTVNIVDRIDAAKFEAADLEDNDSLIVNAIDVQVGNFMASHIPNAGGSGTSVTRAGEVMSVDVSSIYVDNQGTVFVQFIIDFLTGANQRIIGTDGDPFRSLGFFMTSGNFPFVDIDFSDGATVLQTIDEYTLGAVTKTASSWDTDGRSIVTNGGTVATTGDVDTDNLNTVTTFNFGNNGFGSENAVPQIFWQGVKYWTVKNSDAFIDAETA